MEEQLVKIHKWLYPISFIYGVGVGLRNKLFDWGILQSKSFDIPVICIGNIAIGGTGKTPHTEYLIKLLQKTLNVAVLSRGYKRHTTGYIQANEDSTARSIGDESFQIKKKFPKVTVAVDEKRVRGIENLCKLEKPKMDVVLLDDAFQHRYVQAGINILLTDYHRLFCDDTLLPAGRLRESTKGKNRANIVIVTKCPHNIKPIDFNIIAKSLKLFPYQQLYFSCFKYGNLVPAFPEADTLEESPVSLSKHTNILLVTGIASPAVMIEELKRHTRNIQTLSFDDHHNFKKKDIKHIAEQFDKLKGSNKLIITTEKDAARLTDNPALTEELRKHIYILPVEIQLLQNQQDKFNQHIISYVRKNKRNNILS